MKRVYQICVDFEADEDVVSDETIDESMKVISDDLSCEGIRIRGWIQDHSWSVEDYENGVK